MPDNEIPWGDVILALDTDSRTTASAALRATVGDEPDGGLSRMRALAPLMLDLKSPLGRTEALRIIAPFAPRLTEVSDVAVQMVVDKEWSVRLAAAQVLATCIGRPEARKGVLSLLRDPSTDVRDFALAQVQTIRQSLGEGLENEALRVLPDQAQRARALELLDQLEHAVHVLQDLGLGEAQHRIVDEIVFPAILELRGLLSAEAASIDDVTLKRRRTLLTGGNLVGSAKALALTTSMLAGADDAAGTVVAAVEKLEPFVEMIGHLLT